MRRLCDYVFRSAREHYPLCWLPSEHVGNHRKYHEVHDLVREMAAVLAAEKKKKRGREW